MREALRAQLQDFRWFAERFFVIRDARGELIPFKMNELQEDLHANLFGFDDILKARKGGVSTYIGLWILHFCLVNPHKRTLIMAHDFRSSRTLFGIVRTAYDHLPDALKPALDIDNQTEMKFRGIGSSISVHTSRNADIGRGDTLDVVHCSEIAFWDTPEATMTAVSGALGIGAKVFRESTANGAGNYWHQQWMLGKHHRSGYKTHFFPWWIDTKYVADEPQPILDRMEFDPLGERIPLVATPEEMKLPIGESQIRWRRRMTDKFKARFAQEYAENDIECFLTSGNAVFDNKMMSRLVEELYAKDDLVKAYNEEHGLRVFWEPSKRERMIAEFVIGADTAEGLADEENPSAPGDFSAAYVFEKHTGQMAAAIHGSWEPDEFAHVLSDVGKLYASPHTGVALLGVERNEYGHATINQLRNHIGYPSIYHEVAYDQVRQKSIRKPGWRTSQQTRPIMITDLVRAVNKGWLKVHDPEFVRECLTFVKDKRGRPGAQVGCHDDRVMSAAITWQMTQHINPNAHITGVNLP